MRKPLGSALARTGVMMFGKAAFEAQLIDGGLSRRDLEKAKEHATVKGMEVADALVALSMMHEADSYASLAKATGLLLVDPEQMEISELAIRLVPARLARRHIVVPVGLDNGTLTYATARPFDGEAERDLSFATGRWATSVLATWSSILASLDRLYPTVQAATSHEIRTALHDAGMPSMRQQALALVARGITSLEEIDRVLASEDRETPRTKAGRRVLIADDEPITRMLVKLLLERELYDVLEACTGREAVDIARRERPDLLLIDLNMPEMDGYQAIAQMRKEQGLTAMSIVVLTSEDGPGVERRVLQLGADDYIVKPFDAEVLLARVHAVFRRIAVAA